MGLVAGEHPAEDLHRLRHRGLPHHHRGEAPLQRRVGLEEATELLVGGGPDAGKLTPGQRALEFVGRILGTLPGGPGADQGVDLVEEEHHPSRGAPHLLLEAVEPLGERPAEGRAGEEVRGRQLDHDAPPQLPRRGEQPLGDAFHDGGLADARLTHQAGVVGPALPQDVQHLVHLPGPSHHRIQTALMGEGGEVATQLGEEGKGVGVELPGGGGRGRNHPEQRGRRRPLQDRFQIRLHQGARRVLGEQGDRGR